MDCYLCGASNDPDADFCARCSGQLLKIGEPELEPPAIPDSTPPELPEDEAPADDAGPTRVETISSVEHRRLQAALGLDRPGGEPQQGDATPQVVTARPQAAIPMIGTRTHDFGAAARFGDDEAGRMAYVLLALLVVAVGWLAWSTLGASPTDGSQPDNLAFTNTTVPPTTSTTTTEPPRPWTIDEVDGRYGGVFVRVFLYDCPSEDEGQGAVELDERLTHGVVVDPHNVVFPASTIGTADIATIRGRLGSTTIARINQLDGDAAAATTIARMNKNLHLENEVVGADTYYVHYNFGTNVSTVGSIESTSDLELTVTDQGEATAVRFGRRVVPHESLLDVAEYRTGRVVIEGALEPTTVCDHVKFLIDTTPIASSDGTESDDDQTDSDQ